VTERGRADVTLVAGTWPDMQCGIAPYSYNLARGLRDAGVQVQVITAVGGRLEEGLAMETLSSWGLRGLVHLFAYLRRSRPCVVHLQHPTRATRFAPAVYLMPVLVRLLLPRIRVVTTFHYLRPVDLRTALLRAWFLVPAAASHAVIVTTEREAGFLGHLLPRKRTTVVPAGLTLPLQRPSDVSRARQRAELGFSPNDFVVGYFGFLLPNKGVEDLVRALARTDPTVKGLIIGTNYPGTDDHAAHLLELAQRSGISDRLVFTGAVPEDHLAAVVSCADAAALPFHEGASLKRSSLLACLALNIPVVTTRGPELDPEMTDGKNLLLVPPRDATRLASAFEQLRVNADLRRSLATGGSALLRLVSWELIVDRHLKLYHSLSPLSGAGSEGAA